MKIVFISGVKFGFEILEHIINHDFNISLVFSYSDSKKKNYSDSASFDVLCKERGIKNIKVDNINDPENIEIIKSLNPDIILVMGWSQLLKNEIIKLPKLGVIGSHPTELPKFRGRAPIPWTIIKNLKESALTFFYIEEGVDDGDILDQEKFKIHALDDANSLYQRITEIGKNMIIKDLTQIQQGTSQRIRQDPKSFIENWPKRTPDDGKINWKNSGKIIHALIRATTHPYPGAFTFYNGKKLKIFNAELLNNNISEPGKILQIKNNGVEIGTGDGTIILKSVQIEQNSETNSVNIFTKNNIGNFLK
tara:strand:+ start:140 stop:1060 length:921 start_codon:yes stop_codon:yes gene_type:complete